VVVEEVLSGVVGDHVLVVDNSVSFWNHRVEVCSVQFVTDSGLAKVYHANVEAPSLKIHCGEVGEGSSQTVSGCFHLRCAIFLVKFVHFLVDVVNHMLLSSEKPFMDIAIDTVWVHIVSHINV